MGSEPFQISRSFTSNATTTIGLSCPCIEIPIHHSEVPCWSSKMVSQPATRIIARSISSSLRQSQQSSLRLTARSLCTVSRGSTFRQHIKTPLLLFTLPAPRNFQTSHRYNGILGDSSAPAAREETDSQTPTQRTEIELADYHRLADYFLEQLLRKLEQRQEEKGDLDAEYSVRYCTGMLTWRRC